MKMPNMPPLPSLQPSKPKEIIKPYSGEYEVISDIWDRNGLQYLFTGDKIKVVYREVVFCPVVVSVFMKEYGFYVERYVYEEKNFTKILKHLKKVESDSFVEEDHEGMVYNDYTGEWKWL